MASSVTIANRALQKVGAATITSFDEGSREADQVKLMYEPVRKAELQDNLWTFSIKRKQLSAETATPAFGRSYQYQLPADYIRKAPLDPSIAPLPDDILFEGRLLLTDDNGPMNIRYVSSDTEEETYDPMFVEAFAARLAMELAEPLTQSATKRKELADDYIYWITRAKSANSIQSGPREPEIDEWVSVRAFSNTVFPSRS